MCSTNSVCLCPGVRLCPGCLLPRNCMTTGHHTCTCTVDSTGDQIFGTNDSSTLMNTTQISRDLDQPRTGLNTSQRTITNRSQISTSELRNQRIQWYINESETPIQANLSGNSLRRFWRSTPDSSVPSETSRPILNPDLEPYSCICRGSLCPRTGWRMLTELELMLLSDISLSDVTIVRVCGRCGLLGLPWSGRLRSPAVLESTGS